MTLKVTLFEKEKIAGEVLKDLGYPRTPTCAFLRTVMPDGSKWDVPLQCVADSRDEHYKAEGEDSIGFIRDGSMEAYALEDWAANNMNWDEVQEFAVQAAVPKIDWQEGWVNGDKEIIGLI